MYVSYMVHTLSEVLQGLSVNDSVFGKKGTNILGNFGKIGEMLGNMI